MDRPPLSADDTVERAASAAGPLADARLPADSAPDDSPPASDAPADYDAIADAYDRFWGDMLAPAMLAALDRLLAPIAPGTPSPNRSGGPLGAPDRRPRLLDLCCGTGQLAAGLVARGWSVVGVDGSGAMLGHARRRAPAATFVQADIRAFDVGDTAAAAPFDAVVCAFDSLNHLPDAEALGAVFARVLAILGPAGRFVFDMNLRDGFEARFDGSLGFADPDLVCVVQAAFDGLHGRYDITVLRPDVPGGGVNGMAWRRVDVALIQRCFELPEILQALHGAGFPDPIVLDAEADLGMDGHVGRAVFVVDRPA